MGERKRERESGALSLYKRGKTTCDSRSFYDINPIGMQLAIVKLEMWIILGK